MPVYWIRECGHKSLNDPWKQGEDQPLRGICLECRTARIGERIQFARHGAAPASGWSKNHREGVAEAGVSVYEIRAGQIQYVGWHYGISERPLYLGEGVIVGWGSDGEPVVAISTIKKATKRQAAALLPA